MATRKIVPRADNEGGLGTVLKRWASAFINALTVNTIALLGGQIAFPATQAPSSDPNTLDDYEEGLWTPGISFGGGTTGITYSASYQTGYYTKKGREVTLTGIIILTSKGSSTGVVKITGLPFLVINTNAGYTCPSLKFENIKFANQYTGYLVINTTEIALQEITEAGVVTSLDDTDFANNSQIILGLSYVVA